MSTDYAEAFQHGIEAAQNAERDRAEIEATFHEFSETVRAASSGRISAIEIKKLDSQVRKSFETRAPEIRVVLNSSIVALGASKTDNEPRSEELSRVSIPGSGYPVLITFDGNEYACHDKESLKLALIRLLEHPTTGKKILRLMNGQKDAA